MLDKKMFAERIRELRKESEALELMKIFRSVDDLTKGMIIGRAKEMDENY
ncbi:MAG: hypothetical protein PHE79_11310 [Eubacteriales bacterium]|nr:hypothetical protein [Eubacteriales bacterium]